MKLTILAHAIEIALIAFLILHIFVLNPSQSQSNQSSTFSTSSTNFTSPQELTRVISSAKNVTDDLSSLGCKLMNISYADTKIQSGLAVNYSDFRWTAYNTKLVYYAEVPSEGTVFLTFYQGLAVVFGLQSQTSNTEGGSFTKYEKVEFTTAYVTGAGTNSTPYVITMNLKNTGSAAATIDQASILYNGKPANVTSGAGTILTTFTPSITMNPGETSTGTIVLPTTGYSSGMTLEVTLHTTGGKDYPKVITLP